MRQQNNLQIFVLIRLSKQIWHYENGKSKLNTIEIYFNSIELKLPQIFGSYRDLPV